MTPYQRARRIAPDRGFNRGVMFGVPAGIALWVLVFDVTRWVLS